MKNGLTRMRALGEFVESSKGDLLMLAATAVVLCINLHTFATGLTMVGFPKVGSALDFLLVVCNVWFAAFYMKRLRNID
jgi:hypothetical protein